MSNLTIIPRHDWRAAPPRGPLTQRDPHTITELFVHWPGSPGSYRGIINTREDERQALRDIQASHFSNKWSDIGYNYVLIPDYIGDSHAPRVYVARGIQYTPAAQLNHNTGTLSIMVLAGARDKVDGEALARLRSFVRWADEATGKRLRIRGHGEVFSTECPGPQLREWVKSGRHR